MLKQVCWVTICLASHLGPIWLTSCLFMVLRFWSIVSAYSPDVQRTWHSRSLLVVCWKRCHLGMAVFSWGPSISTVFDGDLDREIASMAQMMFCYSKFCAKHGMSITNTIFKHKVVHECIWHKVTCRPKFSEKFSNYSKNNVPYPWDVDEVQYWPEELSLVHPKDRTQFQTERCIIISSEQRGMFRALVLYWRN